jgi:hypothetical protein
MFGESIMKLRLFDWVTYAKDHAYSTFSDVKAEQAQHVCLGLVIRISNKKQLIKVLWASNLDQALKGRTEELPACFLDPIKSTTWLLCSQPQENFWSHAEDDSGTNGWW